MCCWIMDLKLHFLWLHVQITEQNTDNDVNKFMHSNWITPSYYSSPKHKSDF